MLSPIFPAVEIPSLKSVELPQVYRVKLDQPQARCLEKLARRIDAGLGGLDKISDLPPDANIAVAVGSRGIARIDEIVAATIDCLKRKGLRPFIVPAMGSHGGGTADGQIAVLAKLGVTEEHCGAPIRASMAVVELGRLDDGIPVHFDAEAASADAVLAIARVKSHTSFDRDIESGLTKMVAIGLGKQEGARTVHRLGLEGLRSVLPRTAELAIAKSPLVAGIAVVESAAHEIVHLEAVPANDFLDTDRRLLKLAKSLLARLPFSRIDALCCQELGKEISGSGMDFAVTGRTDLRGWPNPDHILITKLALLRLTAKTAGNGLGVGLADFMPMETANALDLKAMFENSITSTITEKSRIPIVLPTERETLQATLATSWASDPSQLRYCQIKNTLELAEVLVSGALFQELGRPGQEPPQDLLFDRSGRLQTWL